MCVNQFCTLTLVGPDMTAPFPLRDSSLQEEPVRFYSLPHSDLRCPFASNTEESVYHHQPDQNHHSADETGLRLVLDSVWSHSGLGLISV